jgi:hypothetical protein
MSYFLYLHSKNISLHLGFSLLCFRLEDVFVIVLLILSFNLKN